MVQKENSNQKVVIVTNADDSETESGTEFLKCDAPGCDHFENTPVTIEVVGKPCPKCGANLCTQEDFVIFKSLSAATRAATEVIRKNDPAAPMHLVATNVHNGVIKIAPGKRAHENPFPNDNSASESSS